MPAFLINSLNHSVYLIMDNRFFPVVNFCLFNLSNSENAFPGESNSSQFFETCPVVPLFIHIGTVIEIRFLIFLPLLSILTNVL
jgi:hypothetical protein